jgi:Transposase IS116/IS110/IS902 family
MLVLAELGAIGRFRKARRLCAWAGLTPTGRSSHGKARLGHISRQGARPLRWALVEAAQQNVRGAGPLRDDFERIAKRRGRKIAKVAVARKILNPLLLRPARRRDPLPGAPPAERDTSHGGPMRTRRRPDRAAGDGRAAHARASSPYVMSSGTRGRPTT